MSAPCCPTCGSAGEWRGREGDAKKSFDNWECPERHAYSTPAK